MELYLSYLGQTEEELREQMKPEAEDRLNTTLILRKLADLEKIEIGEDDVEAEINNLISSTGGESEVAMKQALNTDNAKDSIRSSLMNRKIMARLVELVQGTTPSSPEAASNQSEAEQVDRPEAESSQAEEAKE